MTNLLEPWVLLRLAAGLVAFLLFARGASTAQKVLRHFDARRVTEGQLALEKRQEDGGKEEPPGCVVHEVFLSAGTGDWCPSSVSIAFIQIKLI